MPKKKSKSHVLGIIETREFQVGKSKYKWITDSKSGVFDCYRWIRDKWIFIGAASTENGADSLLFHAVSKQVEKP